MSYILDALKKSEQERGRGSAPSVQTLHSSGLNYHSDKTQLWPYFLLAAIIINLGALFYFIIAKTDTEATAREQQARELQEIVTETAPVISGTLKTGMDQNASAAAQASDQAESILYKPVSMPGTARKTVVAGTKPAVIETRQLQDSHNAVLEMDELPFDVLQQIPALEFSAHVYSSNPLQRSIVINGRFMEEGDRLAGDLFVNEITPDGAIFDYQGQLFHQAVISAWN